MKIREGKKNIEESVGEEKNKNKVLIKRYPFPTSLVSAVQGGRHSTSLPLSLFFLLIPSLPIVFVSLPPLLSECLVNPNVSIHQYWPFLIMINNFNFFYSFYFIFFSFIILFSCLLTLLFVFCYYFK